MHCFHCGRTVELKMYERVGFRDRCPDCDRALHVCLNCEFYDPTHNNECRETEAARVADKDRANFCEYFTPRKGAAVRAVARDSEARAKLETLFKKRTN